MSVFWFLSSSVARMEFCLHTIFYVDVMDECVNAPIRRDFQMMVKMMVEALFFWVFTFPGIALSDSWC